MSFWVIQNASAQSHEQFLNAEKHLKKNQHNQFQSSLATLDDHPLLSYLQAKKIRKQFHNTPIEKIDLFLAKHQGEPAARLLQRSWIWHLAKKKQWRLFLEYFHYTENLTLRCHRVTALEATHRQKEAFQEGKELWLKGVSLPKACDKLYSQWQRNNYLTDNLIWQRLLIAQEKRKYKLVRFLKKKLPHKLKKDAQIVQSLWRRPHKIIGDTRVSKLDSQAQTMLFKKAIKHYPSELATLENLERLNTLNKEQITQLKQAALNTTAKYAGEDSFPQYFKAKQNNLLDPELESRFLLGAVRTQNWPLYTHLFKVSSANIKTDAKWLYWQGRALESLGTSASTSQVFYKKAAHERDYYGFLASQKLGVSASMNHNPTQVDAATLKSVKDFPSVKRAMAFLELKRISHARREWQFAFDNLDKEGRQALAVIAGRMEWNDRPIFTLAQQKSWHDLQLRFPLAHEPLFDKAARKSKISKNWIYGIARQESAFMHDALSPVGATGLMQLMPSTAKSVSRHQRIKYSKKRLLEPAYNIQLGSLYLKELLHQYKGNRVLATAAYNAGPGNVRRWLKGFSGPMDIWIENIPFKETKEYVQRVLAYSTIYSYRLGELQPIIDNNTLAAWSNLQPNNLTVSQNSNERKNKG
jgi:soluble lytic murein transglycosylase